MGIKCGFQIKPIPDETSFGMLVTAGILAGFETYSQVYSAILGNDNLCPSTLLPKGLERLSDYLPHRYQGNADPLCLEHTALPYFMYFSNVKNTQQAKAAMWDQEGLSVRKVVGLSSTPVKDSRHLKYCHACAKEQLNLYKRTTWLRSHQLPGVTVCHRHGLSLTESPIATVRFGGHSGQIQLPIAPSGDQSHRNIWSVGDPWDRTSPSRMIAQISHELLISRTPIIAPHVLGRTYRSAFIAAGYSKGRYVDWVKLETALRETYGDLIPRRLGLDFSCSFYGHWIRRIAGNRESTSHPLQHILLTGAVFESLEQQRVTLEAEAERAAPYRTFSEIRRESVAGEVIDPQKLARYRQTLQKIVAANPQTTRTKLKRQAERCYQWLLSYDNAWMKVTLPPKAVGIKRNTINWDDLDEKLASEVKNLSHADAAKVFDENLNVIGAQIARLSELSYLRVMKLLSFPKTEASLNCLRRQFLGTPRARGNRNSI